MIASSETAQRLARRRGDRCVLGAPERHHAARHCQRPLDLVIAGIGEIGVPIRELEVNLRQSQRTVVAQMRHDDSRGLEREDLRPRALRVPHEIDEHVAVVGGDGARGGEIARPWQFDEAVGRLPERSRDRIRG